MANITRIKNNQITDSTITYAKLAPGTLVGSVFNSNLTLNSNVTVIGNLSVTGDTSTIQSTNTYVNDPLIVFNNGYTGTPSYDIGIIANRNLQNLPGYGNYNTAFIWEETAGQWQVIATTETGSTTGAINNSGWANIRVGNLTAISGNVTGAQVVGGTLAVTGAATLSSTLGVTGDATFTTGNIGGLQAKAIGNITPGTGAFTTLSTTGNVTVGGNISITGNIVPSANVTYSLGTSGLRFKDIWLSGQTEYLGGSIIGEDANGNLNLTAANGNRISVLNTAANTVVMTGNVTTPYLIGNIIGTTGVISAGLQATAIGNITPGTATFTTGNIGGLQAVAIGNITPGTAAFTTTTTNTGTIGGLQAVAIGNVTPGTAVFTSANATVANVTGTTASTSTTTGALVVAGGVGVAGAVNTGANVTIGGTVPGITTPAGTNKDLIVDPDGTGNVWISANVIINYGTASTSTTTGVLVVTGGVGISGNVNLGASLQAPAIGNVTPGTAAFTTATAGGLQATAIGNVTPGTAAFTTATAGGLQAVAIGNATPGTGTFTTGGFTGNSTHNYLFSNVGTTSLTIGGNAITSNTGVIGLGSISNVGITGGANGYTVITNGSGTLSFNPANVLVLGANTVGQLTSSAVSLTSGTNVTDAIAQLNQILGKLTPASPPTFPGNVATSVGAASTFSITTGTSSGVMTGDAARGSGWTQKNNIAGNTYQLAGGTTFSAIRSNTYATSTLAAIKSGQGAIRVWLGGNILAGTFTLTGSSGTNTNGNLTITNDTDYHNVVASVAAGFWQSANISASGSNILEGWNTVTIENLGGYTTGNTNALLWYNDVSVAGVGTPTFSNTSMAITTNSVVYSSSIPHLTSGSAFRLKGNVANLSGDTYISTANTNITTSTAAGGAFNAPTAVATSSLVGPGGWAGTVPLPRYLCNATNGGVYAGTAYLETTATTLTTGFGSSSSGPTLTVNNNYNSAAGSFTPGVTILYKTGTNTNIEETSIPVNSVGTGSGNGFRVASQGSSNNPVYTAGNVSSPIWNSQTTTLQTYDCVNIGSGSQGILAWTQTNYSTGYLPVGPNLSGQATTQYFTMKFIRTAVSKFDIKYTGTIAGLWVALPGGSPNGTDTYAAPTNGWLDVSTAYAGSGIPGTGTGGNGSAGCAVGGNAVLNSAQTNKSVTATFGSLSSTNSTNNEIWVRVAFTSGQSLTALTMETATH